MEQLLYIGKVGVLFALLYSIYFIFFKNTTLFQANRFYLLLIIPISFILPLINWESSIDTYYTITLPNIDVVNNTLVANSYNLYDIVSAIYLAVSFLLTIKFIYSLIRISIRISYLKKGKTTNVAPFSFFHFIHIPKELDNESKHEIITHEKVHAQEFHSLDVLVYELLKILLWWNPLVWMASYSVKCNHEFIADNIASKNSKEKYSSVLIAQLLGVNCSMLANNFNYKPLIKRRIMMMKTTKTKSLSMLKYALVIPVALVFVTVSVNQKAVANTTVSKAKLGDGDTNDKVEVMPEFKGGKKALMDYMINNIKYPKDTQKEGKVQVSFVIDEKGNVTEAKVVKSVAPALDNEALRVINAMPKWTPGKDKGKNVKVKMVLPINFQLS